jgi:glycosyltransferase involved in cell wall biosynthesis
MSQPRVSVVIPTYQRCASVRRALEALVGQTIAPSEYEVIVVVDGSTDGTREMLAGCQVPYWLAAVWQPNGGRASARNAGIARARGELVVFLDDDMEPVPAFLAAHLDAHPPGSRRAVVGPVPIPDDSLDPPIVAYRRQGMHTLLERLAEPGYRLGFRDIYTGNLSVRREVLQQVGAFDAAFTLYGHEDYEIALRLVKAGVELAYCPPAVAYQRYEKDFPAMARDCIARGETAVLFARIHPDAAAGLRLAGYGEGSWKWRLLRSVLLWISDLRRDFPERLMQLVTRLEQRRPRRLHAYYTMAVDFFFWLGARSARAREEKPGHNSTAVPTAMRVGVGLLVLFAVASSARLVLRAIRDPAMGAKPDEVTAYESRFSELRRTLPAGARLGYVTDAVPPPAAGADDPGRDAFKRYLLAQYTLLPAILRPDADAELVLGNFASSGLVDTAALTGLEVVHDFGQGVVLLRGPRR